MPMRFPYKALEQYRILMPEDIHLLRVIHSKFSSWRGVDDDEYSALPTAAQFFGHFDPSDIPFAIMSSRTVDRMVETPEEANAIDQALDCNTPYKWPEQLPKHQQSIRAHYADAYLFGEHLWYLKASEHAEHDDELRLLFLDAIDSERRKFERLKQRFSGMAGASIKKARQMIPEEVRMFVWRRDGGACVQCGSRQRLEFDHVIPVSRGGSDTARNLQLLCELCNRRKGDGI